MTNKKNKLFTFFFSLIPGAGEMYLGFYKMGASVMILFFGDVALASSLFPPLLYLLPVMWFFSFFHTHNLNNMADEEFYALEDGYLFDMSPGQLLRAADRHRKPLALILGGETVVRITGKGKGGRNQELALAAAPVLAGTEGTALFSVGSDGTEQRGVSAGGGGPDKPHSGCRPAGAFAGQAGPGRH